MQHTSRKENKTAECSNLLMKVNFTQALHTEQEMRGGELKLVLSVKLDEKGGVLGSVRQIKR